MAKKATARQATAPDVEVLPALPEQSAVETDATTILSFVNGVVPFFRTAQQLEETAKGLQAEARLLKLPAPGDVDGDAKLQAFIRGGSAMKKSIEQHWSITSFFSQFHRKLTAARGRAVDAAQDAIDTAQRLHNTYVADATRRQREAQQRALEEERRVQEQARAAEQARLEQAAAEAEAASPDLSPREKKFADDVASGVDPVQAARQVGYKAGPERLLALPKIQQALEARRQVLALRQQAQAEAQRPLDLSNTPTVRREVAKVGTDVSYRSAEILDERALVMAVLAGGHGIPTDILKVDPVVLNRYAKDLGEVINRWPGCRLKIETRTR